MDVSRLISLLIIGILTISCTAPLQIAQPTLEPTDPYYTSAFPTLDVSTDLERIQESIIRIASTGIYRTYYMEDSSLTAEQLDTLELDEITSTISNFEETTAGTATIIGKSEIRALLITNAHTISFADTVITYYKGDDIPDETYIESVTVKQRQANIALTEPMLVSFNIIDIDVREDLALIELSLRNVDSDKVKPVNLSLGNSENLRTGSVVYILGFPKGFPMVTQGLVSNPNRNRKGAFLTDALFNRGVSGGLIIASKNNFEDFEWIGMANAGVATHEYYLVPDDDYIDSRETLQPYNGPLVAERKTSLDYGITYAIPTQVISEFLVRNRSRFRGLSHNLRNVF